MDLQILPSEWITRYILERKKITLTKMKISHRVFMPNKNGETSVYRIDGLSESVVWQIGERNVASECDKPLLGRADISASNVTKHGLNVKPDIRPHPRHANIIDWPNEGSRQRLIALELAADAQLRLYKSSGVST